MKRIDEIDGNANGPDGRPNSRFHSLASRIVLGGVVLDADTVDFESVVRFRYRVVRKGFIWCIEKQDKRAGTNVLVAWYWTRKAAQYSCWLANHASDLALTEGFI